MDESAKSCTLENNATTGGKMYQFDAVFGAQVSTEAVYEGVGSVVVEAVLEGYNGTVFAYGQTGCGKSYTMNGVIERSLEHLFEATSTSTSETRYLALFSYLEIYNERLRDLLQDGDGDAPSLLQLKEEPSRGTYVAGGLREITVKDAAECVRLLEQGGRRRALAATRMNAESSRSHAVLTLALEAIAINDQKKNAVRKGRLHLVDLAGSERQARTGATGDRLKEASSINLSLSALGNVISALAAGNGRHVPYRDSKLTRLLRDSLGGNARTLMIACVSPSDLDAEETLSTLRYAARARCIKNKPIVNEDPKDALLRQYQLELQRLRKLLESNPEGPRLEESGYEEQVEILKKECENSTLSAQRLQEELANLKARFERKESGDEEEVQKKSRRKEAARNEVLKRLERLTIGGEAIGDAEARRRRERRRRRLQALIGALESTDEASEGAVEVYGQLKSTEEALRRAARRAKQLEAEAADLQASWDAERRELLRRELLATQLCDAMIPHLRPGCPLRDLEAIRAEATWCDELARWRLPDVSLRGLQLPPTTVQNGRDATGSPEQDLNNNDNEKASGGKPQDIADTYFRRSRVDALLAHAREAKTLEYVGRQSKSGGSEDSVSGSGNYFQLNALNLQSSAPTIPSAASPEGSRIVSHQPTVRGTPCNWLVGVSKLNSISYPTATMKKIPPRILEALPSYPLKSVPPPSSPPSISTAIRDDNYYHANPSYQTHTRSPTY